MPLKKAQLEQLAELANSLDEKEEFELADQIDEILTSSEEQEKQVEAEQTTESNTVSEILSELQEEAAPFIEKVQLARAALYRQLASEFNEDINSKLQRLITAALVIEDIAKE